MASEFDDIDDLLEQMFRRPPEQFHEPDPVGDAIKRKHGRLPEQQTGKTRSKRRDIECPDDESDEPDHKRRRRGYKGRNRQEGDNGDGDANDYNGDGEGFDIESEQE